MPDIEKIKREGVALNLGPVARQGYKAVSPDDFYRLKTKGVCSQRNPQAEGHFFLRIKVPFGLVRPAQLATLADLAEQYGRGWGHLTTRQGIELHSVNLEDVPAIFEQLEGVGLTTKAACGDTIRNVVTCNHTGQPLDATTTPPLFDARPWALLIQNHFLELGPEKLNLPRKMNVYVTGCRDCIGHARINDLGLVATSRKKADGSQEAGFALWIGGGLGANPILGHQLRSFLNFDEVLPALEAVVCLYIDHGFRKSRAGAKLKFLIEEWGMGRFNSEFERYFAEILPLFQFKKLPRKPQLLKVVPKITRKQPPTESILTGPSQEVSIFVPGGEISGQALRALADLVLLFGEGQVYFTKEQNICFKNLDPLDAPRLQSALREAGFELEGAARIDDVLACPGTAFCPIGVTPSLNTGEKLGQQLRQLIVEQQLPAELQKLRIHISGCPNSCAQHQVADIGLSGTRVHPHSPDSTGLGYQLFLGGSMEGTGRLGLLVHYGIPEESLSDILLLVLKLYAKERLENEDFSEYVNRIGQERWEERLENLTNLTHY